MDLAEEIPKESQKKTKKPWRKNDAEKNPTAEQIVQLKLEKEARRQLRIKQSHDFEELQHHIPKVPVFTWVDVPQDLALSFVRQQRQKCRTDFIAKDEKNLLPPNSTELRESTSFSIATYNVLSQHLVRREVYRFEPHLNQKILRASFSIFNFRFSHSLSLSSPPPTPRSKLCKQ